MRPAVQTCSRVAALALVAILGVAALASPPALACSQDEPGPYDAWSSVSIDQLTEPRPFPATQLPDDPNLYVVRRQTVAMARSVPGFYDAGVRFNVRAWGPGAAIATGDPQTDGSNYAIPSDEEQNDPDYCFFPRQIAPLGKSSYLIYSDQDLMAFHNATDDALTEYFGEPIEMALDQDAVDQLMTALDNRRPHQTRVPGRYGIAMALVFGAALVFIKVRRSADARRSGSTLV